MGRTCLLNQASPGFLGPLVPTGNVTAPRRRAKRCRTAGMRPADQVSRYCVETHHPRLFLCQNDPRGNTFPWCGRGSVRAGGVAPPASVPADEKDLSHAHASALAQLLMFSSSCMISHSRCRRAGCRAKLPNFQARVAARANSTVSMTPSRRESRWPSAFDLAAASATAQGERQHASAVTSAVIRWAAGVRWRHGSRFEIHAAPSVRRDLVVRMSMMLLRVLMPKRVTKPPATRCSSSAPGDTRGTPPTSAKAELAEHQADMAGAVEDEAEQQQHGESCDERVDQSSRCAWPVPRRLRSIRDRIAGQLHMGPHLLARFVDDDATSRFSTLPRPSLPAARAIVVDAGAAIGQLHVGEAWRSGMALAHRPWRASNHRTASGSRARSLIEVTAIHGAIATHIWATSAPWNAVCTVSSTSSGGSQMGEALRFAGARRARRAGRCFYLNVTCLAWRTTRRRSSRCDIELVEVFAKDIDHHIEVSSRDDSPMRSPRKGAPWL